MAAVKSFVLGLNYTLMEYSPGLLSSSHLPHCEYPAHVSLLLAENKNVSVWGWNEAESWGELFGI